MRSEPRERLTGVQMRVMGTFKALRSSSRPIRYAAIASSSRSSAPSGVA